MTDVSYEAFFDDYQLTLTPGLRVLGLDPYRLPKRSLDIGQIIQSDKSAVSGAFYTEKLINLRIDITRDNFNLRQQSQDTLLARLQGIEKNLLVPQNFGFRRYTATLEDFVITKDNGSYLEATIVFRCSDRYGYEPAKTLLLNNTAITTNYRIISLATVDGSAQYQAPIITATFTSVTNGGSPSFSFGNPVNGQIITIYPTAFAAGDLIVIDSSTGIATQNGISSTLALSGAFPLFTKGLATLSYTDTLTARNLTVKVEYNKRFV